VPAIWVDRMGAKVGVTEQYSRSSKGSLALLAQVRPRKGGAGSACCMGCGAATVGPVWLPGCAVLPDVAATAAARFSSCNGTRRPDLWGLSVAGDHHSRRDWCPLHPRHAHHALWPIRRRRPPHQPVRWACTCDCICAAPCGGQACYVGRSSKGREGAAFGSAPAAALTTPHAGFLL
jgi:hypothetical protein